MKISEQWLREWVNPRLDAKTLAERLTLAGLEVSSLTPAAAKLERVIVGEIRVVTPHPSADRLRVCEVSIGKNKSLSVVCGAPNVRVGMKAPVALIGANLPNGASIQETDVRGIFSSGMLCSAAELGLEDSSEGLLDLGPQAKLGENVADALDLDDWIMEVDLTPNRGDCLSIRGLAREVAALTGAKLVGPRLRSAKITSRRRFEVNLEATAECPHYVGRVIENINPKVTTPLWLRERLRRVGQRCIHPVVDVTNYVMLELGQPMHAFDFDRLEGKVIVRRTHSRESLALLDGNTVEVEKGTLFIADARGPIALAGIMGGRDSAVGEGTGAIFLESAYFQPEAISRRAQALGIQSESSHRFERGVDPLLQREALERATGLLLEIVGGQAGPVVERTASRSLPKSKAIVLRPARVGRILSAVLAPKEITATLTRLGMRTVRIGENFRVLPPSWRFDIRREIDLIEELARVHGYEKLPSTYPQIEMSVPPVPEGRVSQARLRSVLVDRDYQEVITYSFVDPKLQSLLDPATAPITLANPISVEMAAMRTTLWPGLIQTIRYNQNRQQTRLRIFEIGRRFIAAGPDLNQEPVLAAAVTGSAYAEQWGVPAREVDFHDVKADLEALYTLTDRYPEFRFEPAVHPALHPGRAAQILQVNTPVGFVGVLHPELQAKLSLDQRVILFEIALAALTNGKVPVFREISKFPALRRDLALVVSEQTPANVVLEYVRKVAGNLLVNLELFDQYHGKGIDSGRKSLALGLTLQDSSRTLKENEVDAVIARVISALQTELGARLRS